MEYSEAHIRSLDWREHIRKRPGMYIGKLGQGDSIDDGIYVLIKEIIDNSIDEFVMGAGKKIEINLNQEGMVSVRDYGRGIPIGKLVECFSKINTGGKYEGGAFKKSVGLNGVGSKAVNALSSYFKAITFRDGKEKSASFIQGKLTQESDIASSTQKTGSFISFTPDVEIFSNYQYDKEYIFEMLWNYAYLNPGLKLYFNNKVIHSKDGLLDLMNKKVNIDQIHYPPIHLKGDDIEICLTHGSGSSEEYASFANGQFTIQGGIHLSAFKESFVKTIREHYKKDFDPRDIKTSLIANIAIRVEDPIFESQTKTKLGAGSTTNKGNSVRNYIGDFLAKNLDNYLHQHKETAQILFQKILNSEKERKEFAGIKKLAREKLKKVSLHNPKLRDCKIFYNSKHPRREESTLFITEGNSASGSITKSRDVQTHAVFSLKGKPLNCFGMSKKILYQNEEFNLLYHCLNIDSGMEGLKYRRIVIATDADVDGMHIRMLITTFFLEYFPDLVQNNHLFVLETPLFRVRNKKQTIYCYSDQERLNALKKLQPNPEITRFKGLGEISPQEFGNFIGKNIRLKPILLDRAIQTHPLLKYYMGKNTPERQDFIVNHLKHEEALAKKIENVPKKELQLA